MNCEKALCEQWFAKIAQPLRALYVLRNHLFVGGFLVINCISGKVPEIERSRAAFLESQGVVGAPVAAVQRQRVG